ncbi:MAG TPA: competence protein ComFB [Firmicutes bacterium]|jgi:competence protein ComFB|nr:competence protein ComFB [Bacillota bacterium]
MNFKNYMEDVIIEIYNDYKKHNLNYCTCERCMADTIAIALTKMKGKYAVSPEGEIFAKISRDDRQVRADALVVILEAIAQVGKRPNHPL